MDRIIHVADRSVTAECAESAQVKFQNSSQRSLRSLRLERKCCTDLVIHKYH